MQSIKMILAEPQKTRSSKPVKQDLRETAVAYSSIIPNNQPSIDRLFLKLAAIYGQLWRGQFKSEPFLTFTKLEWGRALIKFDALTLDLAANRCRQLFDLPPTLPQFVHWCKQVMPPSLPRKLIERPRKLNSTLAKECMRQIRKQLGMKINLEESQHVNTQSKSR